MKLSHSLPSGRAARFRVALERGPLPLDAALGTRLIAQGLDLSKEDPALWNIERPEAVERLHRLDIAAGAGALTTNTFGANRTWLARFGRSSDVEAINRAAVALARAAAGPDRFVIGGVGPTGDRQAEREQAAILTDAGADALLLETNRTTDCFDDRLSALRSVTDAPILLSCAVGVETRPLPGIKGDPASLGLVAIGWNCLPTERIAALAEGAGNAFDLPLLACPSVSDVDRPVDWTRFAERGIKAGVRLFGGCCGTTEADLGAMAHALVSLKIE